MYFTFFRIKCAAFSLLLILLLPAMCKAQHFSRDIDVAIMVNQAGYMPEASKKAVIKGLVSRKFEIFSLDDLESVFSGEFKPQKGDFGTYSIGDFSELKQEGSYYIKSDSTRSYPFQISGKVHQLPVEYVLSYFAKQRCGASKSGYLAPCHLDDGVRADNGEHQDVTGGWHDASDLRKWVDCTLFGMIGLSKAYNLLDENFVCKNKILNELKWGNQYFLKMQEPEGFVMNFIGGDFLGHSDNNRWTDNIIGENSGKSGLVKPIGGISGNKMGIIGNKDDRIIQTKPAKMVAQYNFIMAEALMAGITRNTDSAYSAMCLQAAEKCLEWCVLTSVPQTADVAGSALQAALEMYKTTQNERFKDIAIKQADVLLNLQAKSLPGEIGGFFYTSNKRIKPYKNIWEGCAGFIGLCDLYEAFPRHKKAPDWRNAIESYSRDYLCKITGNNGFGLVPYGLFKGADPGGNRKVGEYWYRYFMEPELDWWVGINANIASAGVGLLKAAKILNDQDLKDLAQRQFDWIVGVNPYGSSTFIGVGYKHPQQFVNNGEFRPATPIINGAVMNGVGGTLFDEPYTGNGDWQISEYWTPMVAYTLWLMSELTITM